MGGGEDMGGGAESTMRGNWPVPLGEKGRKTCPIPLGGGGGRVNGWYHVEWRKGGGQYHGGIAGKYQCGGKIGQPRWYHCGKLGVGAGWYHEREQPVPFGRREGPGQYH